MDPVLFLQADLMVDDEAARVLMQVTDSELSRRFPEIHLGLPIDTSLMLIVLSVRSPEMVPEFLRRNALVLELEGYGPAERKSLLVDRLWPAALRRCGLTSKQVRLEEPLVSWLVNERAREAGVLELSKLCHQLARRLARRKASGKRAFALTLSTAKACLGDTLPAVRSGVAAGVVSQVVLVPSGAEVVETAAFARPEIVDSYDLSKAATAVLELARSLGSARPRGSPAETVGWHLILPEETLPHDEVVLAFSLALAIRSACLGLAVPRDLAVVGRLGPGGEIAPAGQARERALAAQRAGIRTLLVSPVEGALLQKTLPDEVLAKLQLVPVETLEAAVRAALQPPRRTQTTSAA
jgi:ATP-dependent Lon protease